MTTDDLESYGMEQMTDDEVGKFLASRGIGVLGLPDDDGPYMVPMSYGFDGESRLFFTFVVGDESRKRTLADRAETARFLVYSADTMYLWQSVLLTGTIDELPDAELEELREFEARTWRPELLETAMASEAVAVYQFRIDDRVGIKHSGLPPAFEGPDSTAE